MRSTYKLASDGLVSERTSRTAERAVGGATARCEAHVSQKGPLILRGLPEFGATLSELQLRQSESNRVNLDPFEKEPMENV